MANTNVEMDWGQGKGPIRSRGQARYHQAQGSERGWDGGGCSKLLDQQPIPATHTVKGFEATPGSWMMRESKRC